MTESLEQLTEKSHAFVVTEEELREFRQDYCSHVGGKENLEVQVPHLTKLADGYLARYKQTGNWTDVLKVYGRSQAFRVMRDDLLAQSTRESINTHALYNSVGFRYPDDEQWTRRAFQTQQLYWGGTSKITYEQSKAITSSLSDKLLDLRNTVRVQLKETDELVNNFSEAPNMETVQSFQDKLHKKIRPISKSCTEQMVNISSEIFKHSLEMLAQSPPCAFSVVGLGSIAKGEATPYSDLEYIFLVENTEDQMVKYFENLAMTSYFVIGNLRETKLHTMSIDELEAWFDDRQKNGFRIDGLREKAGKIPTGNGLGTSNPFIVTPNELTKTYRQISDNPEPDAIRGDLTSLLQYTKLIFQYGEIGGDLLENFLSQIADIPANRLRLNANEQMFAEDAKRYRFRPETNLIDHAYSLDGKKEVYRYPSILLSNISILSGFCDRDSWRTLDSLLKRNVISATVYQSLTFLLAFACYIRLSAYLYHDSQDNRLSVLPKGTNLVQEGMVYEGSAKVFAVKSARRWYLPLTLFIQYCECAIALKDSIGRCTDRIAVKDLLRIERDEPTWLVKFRTCFCCHRWVAAKEHFWQHFGGNSVLQSPQKIISHLKVAVQHNLHQLWFTIKALAYALSQEREYDQALRFYSEVLKDIEDETEFNNWKIRTECYDEMGTCYVYLNQLEEAENKYESSLRIRLENCSSKHELVGRSNFYMGKCFRMMKRYDSAIEHFLVAMEIYHLEASTFVHYDYYGDPIPVADTSPISLEHVTSFESKLMHLNNSSVMLGDVLWHLGNLYCSLKYHQRATDCFKYACRMHIDAYGKESYHKDTSADFLYLIYSSWKLKFHSDADRYFRQSAAVLIQLFGVATPKVSHSLSEADEQSGYGENETRNYYTSAVESYLSLPGYNKAHYETAEILLYGATHLMHVEQYDLANYYLEKTIDMYKSIGSPGCHDEEIAIAMSAQGLNLWKKTGDAEATGNKYVETLQILDGIDSQSAKMEAAEILQNMGLMYAQSEKYEKAAHYLSEAKRYFECYCNDKDHPKLAEINRQIQDLKG